MDNLNRVWGRILRNLKYKFIPFKYIRYFKIKTSDGKEYRGKTDQDFKDIAVQIKESAAYVYDIMFEVKVRKIKKEAQQEVDELLSRVLNKRD